MSEKHYINEIGSIFIVSLGLDISTATTKQLKVKKPNGAIVTWDADIFSLESGDYTRLKYITVSGDLDQAGIYRLQPYIVMPTWSGYGETATFTIDELFF